MAKRASLVLFSLLLGFLAAAPAADDDQHRAAGTLKRMDGIANAINAYILDHGAAPDAHSIDALRSLLPPAHLGDADFRDEWGTPFRYLKTGTRSFEIISAGSDRTFDEKSWSTDVYTHDFAADAVYAKPAGELPGDFRRLWISDIGAPLAFSTDSEQATIDSSARIALELSKTAKPGDTIQNLTGKYVTTRSMRAFAILIEAYRLKHGSYPQAKSITELAEMLMPENARDVQKSDAWDTEFRYEVSNDGKKYYFVSAGMDRTFDRPSWDRPGKLATTDDDAVIRNGEFIRKWDEDTLPGLNAEGRRRLKLKPEARALLARADALNEKGDGAGALQAYIDAVKIDSSAADLETIKTYANTSFGILPPPPPGSKPPSEDEERAVKKGAEALRQYLQIHPDDWAATTALVGTLPPAEALASIAPFAKSRPNDPDVYSVRSHVYVGMHRANDALDDLAKAAELDPKNPERYYVLGVTAYELVARGDLKPEQKPKIVDRGLAAMQKAEAMKPKYFEALAYHNLLLRQKALLEKDPARQKKLIDEADALRQRAIEIIKARKAGTEH